MGLFFAALKGVKIHTMKSSPLCIECDQPISRGVYLFSRRIYGHALCMKDQCMLEESGATAQAVDLYLALKSGNFPVVLEYFDGYKHVDIALPGTLYIEVNGAYHNTRPQMKTDLSRSIYSLEKNIPTLIIPNYMLENSDSFDHAVNEISKACRLMMRRKPEVSVWAAQVAAVQMQ